MIEVTAVDCLFEAESQIHVRRIKLQQEWLPVEQGRQWQDEQGHHVLIMTPGTVVQELLLSRQTLQWQIRVRHDSFPVV